MRENPSAEARNKCKRSPQTARLLVRWGHVLKRKPVVTAIPESLYGPALTVPSTPTSQHGGVVHSCSTGPATRSSASAAVALVGRWI